MTFATQRPASPRFASPRSAAHRSAPHRSAPQRNVSQQRAASYRVTTLRFATHRIAPRRTATHRPEPQRNATYSQKGHKMRKMFESSAETTRLVKYFIGLPMKRDISWAAASKAVGVPLSASSSAYTGARRIAFRDHGVVVETIRRFGFVRSDGSDMEKSGDRDMSFIRRRAKRARAKMVLAIENNLDEKSHTRASDKLNRFSLVFDIAKAAISNRQTHELPPVAENTDHLARLRAIK